MVPQPYELKPDGGGTSGDPVIDLNFVTPKVGVYTLNQSPDPLDPKEVVFTVGVRDEDVQTTFGRMFLEWDYSKPIAEAQQQGSRFFSLPFLVKGLCDELVDNVLGDYHLEVIVNDSGFVDTVGNASKPLPGGTQDRVSWRLKCIQPVGAPDGGI